MNFGAQSIEECGNSRVNHLCTWPCMKIEEGEEKKRKIYEWHTTYTHGRISCGALIHGRIRSYLHKT